MDRTNVFKEDKSDRFHPPKAINSGLFKMADDEEVLHIFNNLIRANTKKYDITKGAKIFMKSNVGKF